MKIIFLDIDGVLCTFRSHIAQGSPGPGMCALDREGVGLLNMLYDEDTFYVLSSSWRHFHDKSYMTNHLKKFGWSGQFHMDWCTQDFDGSRGEQIQEWLNRHSEVEKYVIIDDDSNMLKSQKRNFVKTIEYDGISWKNFQNAAKILFGNYQEWRAFYRKNYEGKV